MKKVLIWISVLILLVLLLMIGSYIGLHTKYAPNIVNFMSKILISEPIQINKVTYSYKTPRHLILSDITFGEKSDSAYIPKIEIVFATTPIKNGALHFNRLSINDMKIQSIEKLPFDKFHFQIDEMWLNNAQLNNETITANNINLHIKKPRLITKSSELPFYGEFELSADNMSYHDELFKNVSIAGHLSAQQSLISNMSLQWQQGKEQQGTISIQAQQKTDKSWDFDSIRLSNILIEQQHINALPPAIIKFFMQQGSTIKQLTMTNSSIILEAFQLKNATINISNLTLPSDLSLFSPWQQNDLSFRSKGSDMIWNGYLFEHIAADISANNQSITVNHLNLKKENGGINAQGEFSPTHISLDQLSIDRVNWYPSLSGQKKVMGYLNNLANINIEQLFLRAVNAELNIPMLPTKEPSDTSTDMSKSNLPTVEALSEPEQEKNEKSQLAQFIGIDIDGTEVTLKQDNRWNLWQGEMQINAEQIDYQEINSKFLQISLQADNGHVSINKIIAPINDGLLQGSGNIDFSQKIQPWEFDVEMTGLPLSLIKSFNPLNFNIDGIIDGKMNANGLSGDLSAFQYSVTGSLEANISQASTTADLDTEWQQDQSPDSLRNIQELQAGQTVPIEISNPIKINIDRGRIYLDTLTISSPHYMMLMDIQHDFLKPNDSQFNYRLRQSCDVIETMMQSPEVQALYEDLCSQ